MPLTKPSQPTNGQNSNPLVLSFGLPRATATAPMWSTCGATATIGLPLRARATTLTAFTSPRTERPCTTTAAAAASVTPCVLSRIYKFRKKCCKAFQRNLRVSIKFLILSAALLWQNRVRKFLEKKPHPAEGAVFFL